MSQKSINDNPAVSVIIPTYNRAQLLAEAIQSVLNQTYHDFEIIVVDDGSTDKTFEVAKQFPVKVTKIDHGGPAKAMNAGLMLATGELASVQGADDLILDRNFLKKAAITYLKSIRKADAIVCGEVEQHSFKDKLWQYFAVLTNTKSTGVKGDERAYGWTLAVRIVESLDAMTASFSKVPWNVLERISNRIGNEIPEVTRIVYDITHKPPSTIEWE